VTADQGTVHKLRPRLFPHFVVNSLPLRSNPAPLQATPLPLCMSLTHIGVLDNHSWNKKLASCLRQTHKVKTVGDLEDYMKKDSQHWHCKCLAQTIMEKIPQ